MGATAEIAKFVHDVQFKDLPKEAIDKAKGPILDTIGVALSGTLVPSGQIAISYAKELGGNAEARVFADGLRTSASMAAFTNGMFAHNQDYDDWVPTGLERGIRRIANAGHVSSIMVPATFALGEKLGSSGSAVLLAYVIGVEVFSKVGNACSDARLRGWHSMGIYGPIGAAAAAAKLLDLNEHQIEMAMGIATSAAGGLYFWNQRANTNPFHSGRSARTGVEAALLAKKGFTSFPGMLEVPRGFCDTFHGEGTDYNKMTSTLGKPFNIVYPGLALKPYPCSSPMFYLIEGVLGLKKEHKITFDDVKELHVLVSPQMNRQLNVPEPTSGYHAKFSYNFVAASCLLNKKIIRDTFSDDKLKDPKVREAMAKVKVLVDQERLKETSVDEGGLGYSLRYVTVLIKLKNGKEYKKVVDAVKGDPEHPLSRDEILSKYRENAETVLNREKIEKSIKLVENLEKLENIQELTSNLTTKGIV